MYNLALEAAVFEKPSSESSTFPVTIIHTSNVHSCSFKLSHRLGSNTGTNHLGVICRDQIIINSIVAPKCHANTSFFGTGARLSKLLSPRLKDVCRRGTESAKFIH